MKTVTTEIRLARASDAPVIAEVHDEAWRSAYQGLIPGPELEKLIARRGPAWWESAIRKGNRVALLGFGDEITKIASESEIERHLRNISPEDLHGFGLIPEFVGRLPVVSTLRPLKREELIEVLTEPKNAMVKQYSKLFAMDGVKLRFTPDAVRAIAQKAIDLKTGARALRSIMENIMLEVMYELPQRDDVTEVVIDAAVVAGRRRPAMRRSGKSVPKQDAA